MQQKFKWSLIFVLKKNCVCASVYKGTQTQYSTGYDLNVVHIKLQIDFPECFILFNYISM